jgi:O-antigen/teichoic acid export membrane protein
MRRWVSPAPRARRCDVGESAMSGVSRNVERVDLIVSDPDEGSPPEYNSAQRPLVLHYEGPVDDRSNGRTLKQRAVRSSMWTMVAFGFGQALRVVSSPILAYFLTPEDFGVVGLISVFVTALAALSDVGIEQSIIQNKRGDDPVFLNTAWTVHAIRGVLLWLGCCAIAFPVYWLYQDKGNAHYLLWMLPVAGLGPLLNGFNSTRIFSLNRHLNLGRITVLTLAYTVVGIVVQIAIAMKWRTPWAIVLGGLASNAFWLLTSHTLLPGLRNRFCWDAGVRRELMKFGKWIMISTLITYTAMQIDRPLMGKLLDEKWLGLYMVALSLVRLPSEVISRLASVTLFPALARAVEQRPEDLRRVLWRARGLILTMCVALMLGVVLGGRIFITLFYKEQWHQAGLLVQWASIGAWFMLLQASADRALLALGKTRPLAISNAVNLVVTVVGGFVGWYIDRHQLGHQGGIVGFMLGMAVGKLAGHFMIQMEMARSGIPIYRQDTLYSALLLLMCAVGIGLPYMLPRHMDRMFLYNSVVAVVVCGLTCGWAGVKVIRGIR